MNEHFPKMPIKALALDLDGTLTNSQKKITPRTIKAVSAAALCGIKIILASGRPVLGIRPLADILKLNEGFILAYNGGQIIDCKTDEVIFERLLPVECYPEVCAMARKFGLSALTYDELGVVAESDTNFAVLKEAFNNAIPIRKVDMLDDYIKGPVAKFMIVGDSDKISEALPHAQEAFADRANVFLSEPYFMEFTFPGIEKASALKFLIEHLGLTQMELAACGDGLNDIPMLKFAGCAVAMENACPEAKELADHITASNDEDGVAVFIEEYLL